MNAAATTPPKPGHIVLRDRCREMGISTWRYGANGHIVSQPCETGPAGSWLRSPGMERLVEKQVKRWAEQGEAAPVEVFPGCTLLPLTEHQRRRSRAFTVAVLLSPSALQTEQFLSICQSARADAQAVREALAPMARFTPACAQTMGSVLSWMNADLQVTTAAEQKVASFSRQLTESYEEISLLYKLGQSMNEVDAPLRFVRLTCEELHAVLSFSWIAAYFPPERAGALTLKTSLIMTGQPPCAEEEFCEHAERIIGALKSGDRAILQHEQAGPLDTAGGQLLVHPVLRHGEPIGAIMAGAKGGDDPLASTPDQKMLDAAAGYVGVMLENAGLYEQQQAMFLGTLEALTMSIDAKDPYTCGHSERVAYLASALARKCGISEEGAERIRIAGLVHDVGKIGVPESVLCKPGKLTSAEFDLIKKHPEIGHHILKDIPLLGDVLPGVLHHHERYDGRGYPQGVKGEDIAPMARIIGLVDAFDAMSSNRTYRAAMSRETVLNEIRKGAGTQFDPAYAEAFLNLDLREYDRMVARHHEQALAGDDRFGRPGGALRNAASPPPAAVQLPTSADAQPLKEAA